MEIVRCSKGHFYDSEENSSCPMCAAERSGGSRMFDNILPTDAFVSDPENPSVNMPGPTEPAGQGGGKVQSYTPTVPVGSGNADNANTASSVQPFPKTEPVPMGRKDVPGSTGKPGPRDSEPVFNPVVGWLVCIEGPSKGTDYRIRSQYNFIGRSREMDISIPEDPHISAERSAVIAYDDIERTFFFGPGSGHNGVRVNGKMILNTVMIQAYDVLTVGLTKLLFVPLCGERFNWNDER